jgi:N-ethylmaleimide reductase
MTVSTTITTPIAVGRLQLKNRLVLAPLTRLRNSAEGVPHDLAATYYAQRATGE